jgi:DNA modification methylase
VRADQCDVGAGRGRVSLTLHHGNALAVLQGMRAESVQCCVTSPPYWGLRDYGAEGQLGLEKTPDAYIANMVAVFREVRRVLAKDGTLWLNLGDSYFPHGGSRGNLASAPDNKNVRAGAPAPRFARVEGIKGKDLVGIPWAVAFALRADGWYLRSDIIWAKPNPMPESIRDRPTKSHEYVFLLAKRDRYFYNAEAVKEPAAEPKGPGNVRPTRSPPGERGGENANTRGSLHKIGPRLDRNRRSVWTVRPKPFKGAHFATMPPALARPCVLAGSRPGDTVLDPFNGAGTTGLVALSLGRSYVGIDVNAAYLDLTRKRLAEVEVELFKDGAS